MLMVVSMHASGSQWRVAGRDWQASHRCCCHRYWGVLLGTPLCAHSFEVSLLCPQADASALCLCICHDAVHKVHHRSAHVRYSGQALLTVFSTITLPDVIHGRAVMCKSASQERVTGRQCSKSKQRITHWVESIA